MTEKWSSREFRRRSYTYESPALDRARSIQLQVVVDGKILVRMAAREPGVLAFVSRPKEQGFDIEVVEPVGGRYLDAYTPHGFGEAPVLPWHLEALGVEG